MRRQHLGACALLVAVVAAACGSGDDGEAASATTGAPASTASTEASGTTAARATASTVEATNTDELEAGWKAQRDAVVEELEAGGYGIDTATNTLNGPAGFTVDLNGCPAGWSNTEGLTDDEIKIGQTLSQSGNTADFGNMTRAWIAYMDYINEKFGGITDSTGKTRKLTLVHKDDAYDPARTIPLVDELLDSDRVFALTTSGSANTLRTYDKTNQRCVPHAFVWTGHPAFGDPVNHPWTMGSVLGYATEAIIWGSYMERTLPEGAKVAALVMNNDFGQSYLDGLTAFIEGSDHGFQLVTETFEPTAPTINNEMTTLAAEDPDAFIMMATGTPCSQAITDAAEIGLADTAEQLWQPSVCKPLSLVGRDKVGDASDGWLIVGGGQIDINDPTRAEDPAIVWAKDLLREAGLDPMSSSNLGAGFFLGWPHIETIRIAAQLDGGLTRTNMLLAMRSLDLDSPFLLEGIRVNTDGAEDAYPIEGSEIARFDSAQQTWAQIGDIIDLSGQSPPCAWDSSQSVCG
ncbi:MAG: ABC transporter substrate-binding protein [Acidimicrobiia bacterium]|nr:ABC transporter substrate-binding protein [Acidimicrobiia bacterium]